MSDLFDLLSDMIDKVKAALAVMVFVVALVVRIGLWMSLFVMLFNVALYPLLPVWGVVALGLDYITRRVVGEDCKI